MTKTKGFTLIELLIVIGILAILATTVVLVLNPAQILQESRDTQRLSDLSAIQSAIGLVVATASDPSATFENAGPFCTFATTTQFGPLANTPCTVPAANVIRDIDGDGWVGIDFNAVSGGTSPLSSLPVDPTNNANFLYVYRHTVGTTLYEINGRLESVKQASKMADDGGSNANFYEIGTAPGLTIL